MAEACVLDEFGLLTPEAVSAGLGVGVRTLANWRAEKKGPGWVRVGRTVRYRREAVEGWLKREERGGA